MAEQFAVRHMVEVLDDHGQRLRDLEEGAKEGVETINGVTVCRCASGRSPRRNLVRFKEISDLCFYDKSHTAEDEKAWVS